MNKSESLKALAEALCKAQSAMPKIAFDATNPFLKNRYASLGAVIEASRPILAANGLSLTQLPVSEGSDIGIESILMHASGEWISERIMLTLSEEKGKSRAQVAGSMVTYLRRYSWASILGLYADEDTDGNVPQHNAPAPAAAKPASIPAPTTPTETPEQQRQRFIAKCIQAGGGKPDYAEELFREMAMLLPNESLKDFPLAKLPKTKVEADNVFGEITARSGAGEPPDDGPPDSRSRVTGTLAFVTEKSGEKNGKTWTRFGMKIGDTWYDSFDKKLGAAAKAAKGQEVTIIYEEHERNGRTSNDAQAIIIEGVEYPEHA